MTAKKTTVVPDSDPLVDLSQDTLDHIEAIKKELDQASGDLDALETLGLDTSRLREKINWGYKARDVILARFGQPK